MKAILYAAAALLSITATAQQTYIEGNRLNYLKIGQKNGTIDTAASNPAVTDVNKDPKVIRYTRWRGLKYDNLKLNFNTKLTGIESFASYDGSAKKFKMKVYTNAPAGTKIIIQLGQSSIAQAYPKGTHSQYEAVTTKTEEWEELEFKFTHIPQGTLVKADAIDQATLLFAPETYTGYVFYFDELKGPYMAPVPQTVDAQKKRR